MDGFDLDDEPLLVVPWVMGRNKKDPKSLNELDFRTQLKAARDFRIRMQNQRRAVFRKSFMVYSDADEASDHKREREWDKPLKQMSAKP